VDGEGVNRVCDAMISMVSYIINLTKVEITDINDIFEWRNHPDIRRNFFNQELLSWEEHEKWFTTKLKDSNATVYMAYYREKKVGTIRFESKESVIKTSVMLNPDFLGKGLGSKVIKLGVERFIMEKNHDMQIIAEIKSENKASIKAFQKAGFKESFVSCVFKRE
jgi:RimJ/RimL family protein N-acetyltransferase